MLLRAWRESGGDVVALAPSAASAHVLGEATGTAADTLAKAITELDRGERRLTSSTLIVVDEAGMAGTTDLARLTEHALAAGASVRLVGDDRQLAAVGAGGLLRDIAETCGAVQLSEAVRFADPAESDAAAGLRMGSADALDYYANSGRVRVGDEHTAAESAYAAWRTDRQSGLDSVLLAATREQVSVLNARARADRLAHEGVTSVEVRLADGSSASAGDSIVTKHNDRRLGVTATDWVKNGDRWTVDSVRDDGAITATHHDTGRHVVLPAEYVAAHVALGYATTIHSAQGATADSSHTVISGTETREQLYVAMTRGRFGNHVHVALPGATDEHAAVRADTLIPPSAIDLLRQVLDRDDSARSATTEQRVGGDPVRQLREAVARYTDSVGLAPAAVDESSAPLPWLPPVPRCADERWRMYLDQRAAQIVQLADRLVRDLAARSSPAHPARTEQSQRVLWQLTHPDSHAALTQREQRYLLAQRERQAATRARSPIDAGMPHLDDRHLSR